MITPSHLLRFSLCIGAGVAAANATAQATAPATTSPPATNAAAQHDAAPAPSFEQWLVDFRQRALAAGIEPTTLDTAFAGVTPDPSVQALDQQQPEFTRYLWDYLDDRVTRPPSSKDSNCWSASAPFFKSCSSNTVWIRAS